MATQWLWSNTPFRYPKSLALDDSSVPEGLTHLHRIPGTGDMFGFVGPEGSALEFYAPTRFELMQFLSLLPGMSIDQPNWDYVRGVIGVDPSNLDWTASQILGALLGKLHSSRDESDEADDPTDQQNPYVELEAVCGSLAEQLLARLEVIADTAAPPWESLPVECPDGGAGFSLWQFDHAIGILNEQAVHWFRSLPRRPFQPRPIRVCIYPDEPSSAASHTEALIELAVETRTTFRGTLVNHCGAPAATPENWERYRTYLRQHAIREQLETCAVHIPIELRAVAAGSNGRSDGPRSPRQFVTINQIAKQANLQSSAMTGYVKEWGPPANPKKGRRAGAYRWHDIRDCVRRQFPDVDWSDFGDE